MPPHVSHTKGIDADIRLMRNDGARQGTTYKSSTYSRPLTQQLVDIIRSNAVLRVEFILNNDPQITGVKPWPGHDDHLHVRFYQPTVSNELGEELQNEGMRCNCPACQGEFNKEELGEMPTAPAVDFPVNRKSPAYIQWYQDALNKILPATLLVDGRFGPKTRAAVMAFQRRSALKVDGVVGPITEGALLRAGASPPPRAGALPGPQPIPPGPLPIPPGPLPVPPLPNVPCGPSPTLSAAERDVLSVTSTLEGGRPFHCAVSAVDGISMGSMQWNLKAGTLQAMLSQFERGTGRLALFFGADIDRLKRLIDRGQTSLNDAVAQATAEGLAARWRAPLARLCADPFMCGLQQRDIASRLCTSWDNFTKLSLGTVRGLSMCYDIINGDGGGAMAQVRTRVLALPSWASSPEAAKLQKLANFAADRLGRLREERRARRLNLANIRTPYRGTPATPGRSYADQINRTVPNLDRPLTVAERTVCAAPPPPRPPGPVPPVPRTPPAQQPGAGGRACPSRREQAKGCKTPHFCDPVPDLLCLSDVGSVSLKYLADFTETTPKSAVLASRHEFQMRSGVRDAAARFLQIAAGFGLPITRILSQGSRVCRCITGTDTFSNHSTGEAIDVGGVTLQAGAREVLAVNFAVPAERPLVRRINACLRLAFPRVIDYNYNRAHHDHFHCEISIPARRTKEKTTLMFVQEALSLVLGRTIPVTGKFDAGTQQALREFGATQQDLNNSAQLNAVYDRLFTRVAKG
jgi:peptidoglycan hydrolase-like protein with peptidoglycan-binding domain